MAKPRKVPYYMMVPSAIPFMGLKWKEYMGSEGCVPIATQKTVSMDRLALGEIPPSKPPKPTPEQVKAQKAEEERQKILAELSKKQNKDKSKEKVSEPVDEECENPPVFDLQDIPDAMEKMTWPVSAKIARSWFSRPKHIYNDDMSSIQPIDDTTVTLDWVLKFGTVKDRYKELLSEGIYNKNSINILRKKIKNRLNEIFVVQKSIDFSFNTAPFVADLRQFSNDWQFQYGHVSASDTANNRTTTDLTGALANFNICVAVGNVSVYGDRYHKYDNGSKTKTLCFDPKVEITHVFVYVKDNYSFNDKAGERKSQYLGHWNKTGVIITSGGFLSNKIDGKYEYFEKSKKLNFSFDIHSDIGNAPEDRSELHTVYMTEDGLEMLVDTRKGLFQKHREKDMYFPIYNKTYNEWREKHNQGGDFMIYSKPKYMKLRKPIKFDLETICRPPEPM